MILWGREHQARAQALANAVGESAYDLELLAQSNDGIGALSCSDKTLTIWGHGGPEDFCGLIDIECVVLIKNWKKANSALKTVELVTCDAQHAARPTVGYGRRVAAAVQDTYRDIVVKAMPVGQSSDDQSILFAAASTATYCYITARSDVTMTNAVKTHDNLYGDLQYGEDERQVADAMVKLRGALEPNNFTVLAGRLVELRSALATVVSPIN